MRIITKYLLRQFLGPLAVCLVVFNAMFLVFDLFQDVSRFLEAGATPALVLRYYAALISVYSHWFAPASLMLATLYTMWSLARNSEITAMRASGIGFGRLAAPFLATAGVGALLIAATAEWIVPEASAWAERFKEMRFDIERARDDWRKGHPYFNREGRRLWVFTKVNVISEDSFGTIEAPLTVTQERPDGIKDWAVTAERAEHLDGAWWFHRPRTIRYDIDGGELPVATAPLGAPAITRMATFDETPRDMLIEPREWDTLAVRDMLRQLRRTPVHDPARWFVLHHRFAAPWSCLVVTLFAVPTGLTTARQSALRGLLTALAAFFTFYALSHFGMFLGQQGVLHPALAAWLPNLLGLALGTKLYRRLV